MFDPFHLSNHRQIFAVLSRLYAAGQVSFRSNPKLSRQVVEGAKLVISKRFYLSWSFAIPRVALQNELSFAALRSCIFLSSPATHPVRQFWDGGGNYLSDEWRACLVPNLAFTVLLTDAAFGQLKCHLENPTKRIAAENEESRRLAGLISPPASSTEIKPKSVPRAQNEQEVTRSIDKFIRSVYGDPPPAKRANNNAAISLAFHDLLMQIVDHQEVCEAVWELAWGPVPYTTHELALAGALNIFKQPDNVLRLRQAQLFARVAALAWLKEGLVAPVFVKSFEEVLYERYKPSDNLFPSSPD